MGLSANTWEEYHGLLENLSPADKYVISPELVTCAEIDFEELPYHADLVNQRIETVLNFSLGFGETVFVLGTPLFVEKNKPRNSALLIKNGNIVGVSNKRAGVTIAEKECFEMMAEEPPLLLPETKTALLICADLPLASLYHGSNREIIPDVLRLANKKHLIGKKVETLPSSATSLVVIACWGVGGQWVVPGKENSYYEMQLKNTVSRLMGNTNIREVVIVDRSPNNLTSPYNAIFRAQANGDRSL